MKIWKGDFDEKGERVTVKLEKRTHGIGTDCNKHERHSDDDDVKTSHVSRTNALSIDRSQVTLQQPQLGYSLPLVRTCVTILRLGEGLGFPKAVHSSLRRLTLAFTQLSLVWALNGTVGLLTWLPHRGDKS